MKIGGILTAAMLAEHVPARPLAIDAARLGGGIPLASTAPTSTVRTGGAIALVSVTGPLAQRGRDEVCATVDGYDWITARVCDALADPGVAGVVLVVDSPGGDVAGLEEAVRRMTIARQSAGKPMLAYVDEMAASAAYWLAAGTCDAVYLPPSGAVGSIGCIAVHVDESARAERKGYAYTIVREPGGKAAGSSLEPLGDVGRARLEREVSAAAERFTAAVASARGVSAQAVRALDGDMLTGSAAVAAGLADGVATLEQVIAYATIARSTPARGAARAAEGTNIMRTRNQELGRVERGALAVSVSPATPTAAEVEMARMSGFTPEAIAAHRVALERAAAPTSTTPGTSSTSSTTSTPRPSSTSSPSELTAEDERAIRMHGFDRAAYLAEKARLAARDAAVRS